MKTGFYGRPGSYLESKVHIVQGRKPLCGYKPGKTMKFQWCGTGAIIHYVDCEKCRQRYQKLLEDAENK
jgi:hypothetical protein